MFIERLVQILKERKISAYKLSKDTGIHQSTISQWKSGLQKPSLEAVEKIADYLDCSIDYLLGRGLFSNWKEIMEHKDIIIQVLETSSPFFKDLHLGAMNEDALMTIFPSVFAKIEIDGEEITCFPTLEIWNINKDGTL